MKSCDSALYGELCIKLPEKLTYPGSPLHKQSPERCRGQYWDMGTMMGEYLNHHSCLSIYVEYFYAQ